MPDFRAEVRRRLAGAELDPARELEIVEEIVQHLEERHDELVAAGTPPAQAESIALDENEGLAARLRDVARSPEPVVPFAPRGSVLADLWHDLRYAARALAKNRGFTAVTLLSLALGMGANTALFQLLDALHLRALPVAHPEELARVTIPGRARAGHGTGSHQDLTFRLWEELRDRQEAFSGTFAWGDRTFNMAPSGEASWARGLLVSGDYFAVLGVAPILGRVLDAADDGAACAAVAVASYGFWQRGLGGDPAVIGRRLSLDGRAVEIVGVTPPSFFGLEVGRSFDVALPLCNEEQRRQGATDWWLSVIGRLKPGWTPERATAHVAALSPALFADTVPAVFPNDVASWYRNQKLRAFPAGTGISSLREQYSTPLLFLLGIAALVLLIACANLANLLLARASAREREIAVRLAIGASRGRLVRQLMAESLLLALLGAAGGLLVARLLAPLVVAFLGTRQLPVFIVLGPDGRVLAFTTALAALTCLLFGLAPALRASRAELGLVLKTSGLGTTGDRSALRRALVTVQVALSFTLLFGAALFARSLHNLATLDPGFRGQGLLVLHIDARPLDLPRDRRVPFVEDLLGRLRATAGINDAAVTSILPISGSGWNEKVWLEGGERSAGTLINFSRVSAGYFRTLSTPMVAGRDFSPTDRASAPPVAIVSEAFARQLVPRGQALGRRFRTEPPRGAPSPTYEIVGIVPDMKYRTFREATAPIAFLAMSQDPEPGRDDYEDFLIRASLPVASATTAVRDTVTSAAPRLVLSFDRLDEVIERSMLSERLMAALAGFFGVLAAILAGVGLYGVVSYGVTRRTREIGIRMALGADAARVRRMIARETARLVVVGMAAGVALGVGAAHAASALLYGLAPHDPTTVALTALALAAVALLAAALPARRAARVDPLTALRTE